MDAGDRRLSRPTAAISGCEGFRFWHVTFEAGPSLCSLRPEQFFPGGAVARSRKGMCCCFIREWAVVKPRVIRVSGDPEHLACGFGLFYYESHWFRPFLV
ncbi:MAG: hypothetical protein CR217_14900 [Beijerinckiaceae bacterium]|nr:MAG: hypothetical protein CR217_14900 [Beijerinckiaceae bacterium]